MEGNNSSLVEESHSSIGIGISFFLVGGFGLISTTLLLVLILFYRHMKKEAAFIPIFSLGVADMGHLFIIVYHVAPELISDELTKGALEETLISYANLWVWVASLGHYTLIAINRFCAVLAPAKVDFWFSHRRVSIFCLASWLFGLAMSLLPLSQLCCRKVFDIHHDTEDVDVVGETNHIKNIVWVLNAITFVVIVVCYSIVVRRLSQKNKVCVARTPAQHREAAKKARIAKKVTWQFFIISCIFTGLLVLNTVTMLGLKQEVVIHFLQVFYCANSAVNPVIYCIFNETLRKEMLQFLCCGKNLLGSSTTDAGRPYTLRNFNTMMRPSVPVGPPVH